MTSSTALPTTLSRRAFLRLSGSAAALATLAACAPAVPGGSAGSAPAQEAVTIRYAGLEGMGARVSGVYQELIGALITGTIREQAQLH